MSSADVAQKETDRSKNPGAPKRQRGRPRQFDREEGLRQALKLFWLRGYEATSMSDLRTALGITQASLYAAYESKEAMFREVVDLYLETKGNIAGRTLPHLDNAREAIEAMLREAVRLFTEDYAPGGCLVVLGATNCTAENRDVQEYLAGLRRGTLATITDRLLQAQKMGELGRDVSVSGLAGYYTMVLHGLSIPARDGATREELTQIVNLAMEVWPT